MLHIYKYTQVNNSGALLWCIVLQYYCTYNCIYVCYTCTFGTATNVVVIKLIFLLLFIYEALLFKLLNYLSSILI